MTARDVSSRYNQHQSPRLSRCLFFIFALIFVLILRLLRLSFALSATHVSRPVAAASLPLKIALAPTRYPSSQFDVAAF